MKKANSLAEYYDREEVLREIISSVDHPGQRVWKFESTDGRFFQNRKKINTIRKLRQFLALAEPSKIYVSTGRWLSPHRVYGKIPKKEEWVYANNLFLGSDMLFDLDSETDLNIAHEDGKCIIEWMEQQEGYTLKNIRYSGSKGFHILYSETLPHTYHLPQHRVLASECKRSRLIDKMPPLRTIDVIHKKIIQDAYRVHAAVGTIKRSTGHKVVYINREDFMNLTTEGLLKKYVHTPVRLTPMIRWASTHQTSIHGAGRPGVISAPRSYNFIDAKVDRMRDSYIVVLKYRKGKNVARVLRRAQKQYNLPDFHKFTYGDIDMYLCFKIVDFRRLAKIVRMTRPINIGSTLYFKHAWIPITDEVGDDGKIYHDKPQYRGSLLSSKGRTHLHSRPHSRLMDIEYEHMAGPEQNAVCKAVIAPQEV